MAGRATPRAPLFISRQTAVRRLTALPFGNGTSTCTENAELQAARENFIVPA